MIEERVRAALSDAADRLPAAAAVDHGVIRAAKRRIAVTATGLAVSLAVLVAVGPVAMSRMQNDRPDAPAAASPSPSVEDNKGDLEAQLTTKIDSLNDIRDRLAARLTRALRAQRSAPERNKTELQQQSRTLQAKLAEIQDELRTLLRRLNRLIQERTTATRTATQQIRVTRDTDRGAEVCHPRQVGETVIKHFSAINEGDADRAMNHVAPQQGWYSVTEGNPRHGGRHFVTGSSDELRDYFNRRIAQNERIYLVEIDVAYERARDVAHIAYNLLRTADDLTAYAAEAGGKGAIDCGSGDIAVWSMGQGPEPQPVGDLCPGTPRPPKIALACARGGSHR